MAYEPRPEREGIKTRTNVTQRSLRMNRDLKEKGLRRERAAVFGF